MAVRKASKISNAKRLSLGGEDKNGNPNPTTFSGFYVGRRQQGVTDFGNGPKPTIVLYFLTKDNMETLTEVYEKGDMKNTQFETGVLTTIKWIKLGRPEGATFKTNMYDVELNDSVTIDVSHVKLPDNNKGKVAFAASEEYTEEDETTDDEEVETKYTAPVARNTNNAAKVQELLKNRAAKN